jgi:hypothetical protein
VEFADLSLFTPFGTKIQQLNGVVADVSSAKHTRAQIKLDGSVDRYGTANIDGEFDASDPKTFTDIGVVFSNLEMSRLTPYSGTFAGRKIDSGKLSLDLKYKIDKHQLKGDNQFVVERLTLGEKVQSPDAVSLPLDLAVALLEDADGVINLGLPVSGSLDSPKFSYGALIWKAFVNLLTKIVTSPFRALASLVPGGEEETFNTVAFAAGRPDIPPPEKEKLGKLAGALKERPQLRLDVQGRYHPETDRAELKLAGVQRALASRLDQDPATAADYGAVDFSSPETGQAIELMFSERFGADTLMTLKADQKAAVEKAKKDIVAAKPTGDTAAAVEEDPERFLKDLFLRLVEAETVDEAALVKLADVRAQRIVAELIDVRQREAQDGKPNILVIWGDDIGTWNISHNNRGMMGYRTPNIDRIAKEGLSFTDYYGQQSCTAGRAAFINGSVPVRTGMTKVGMPAAKEGWQKTDVTMATVMKSLGYATGQFGKNHQGDRDEHLPTMHGFDEFFGNLYHLNAEEEPENRDYPADLKLANGKTFREQFGPRGVIKCKADGKGGQTIEDTGPLTKKRMETVDEETLAAAKDFISASMRRRSPSSSGGTPRACTFAPT